MRVDDSNQRSDQENRLKQSVLCRISRETHSRDWFYSLFHFRHSPLRILLRFWFIYCHVWRILSSPHILGLINRAYSFFLQDVMSEYERIKRSCLKRGELWEDPEFPATQASVFYHQTPPFNFQWKRPKVSVRAKFIGKREIRPFFSFFLPRRNCRGPLQENITKKKTHSFVLKFLAELNSL